MSIVKEEGGRLNAFAKEPHIEVIPQDTSGSNASRVLLIIGTAIVLGLIALKVTLS